MELTTSHDFTAKVQITFDEPMRVEAEYGSRSSSEFTTIKVTAFVDKDGAFKVSSWTGRGFKVKANGQVGQAPSTVLYGAVERLPAEVREAASAALHEEYLRHYVTAAGE